MLTASLAGYKSSKMCYHCRMSETRGVTMYGTKGCQRKQVGASVCVCVCMCAYEEVELSLNWGVAMTCAPTLQFYQ